MQEIEVSLGPGQSIDQALLNAVILELHPAETSRRIGGILSEGRVVARTQQLLTGGNWLTDVEKERAIVLLLEQKLVHMSNHVTVDGDSAKLMLAYAKELFARIDKRKAITDDLLTTYDQNVGQQLGHVVDLALTYMRGALREEVDRDKWDTLVLEAMTMAQLEIQKKQVEA